MDELQEREWRHLEETVRRGNCVLVLGPDIALDPDHPAGPPLASRLAEHLAGALSQPPLDPHDLPLVAQAYLQERDHDRYDLELDVQDFYAPHSGRTTAFHRHLAALPFTLSLTATPDDFMAEAFRQAGKSPTNAWYDFSSPGHRQPLTGGDAGRPVVYGLFGNVQHAPSLVLAETELLDFLVTVARGTSGLPEYIAGQLASPQTAFLFVGFGFQRWYTRILLHVLQTHGHRTHSLAIEGEAFFAHPDQVRTALFFRQACSLVFRREAWEDFAAELHRRFADAPLSGTPGSGADLSGAPKVFLCHDSRDRERVSALEQRLNQLGVDTWRDRQRLRGGDDWDRQIKHVLRKQVDYVLVCETPDMVSRGESYLHLEVKEALERQKRFPVGQRFILPATLLPCRGLAELDYLHRVDVTTDAGVKAVAAAVIEDWRARGVSRETMA